MGKKVGNIQQSEEQCLVTDQDNNTYPCEYVVIACSPWQANQIAFHPNLSQDRHLLCSKAFMGSYTKVILLYPRNYWKERGLSGEIVTDCSDSPLMWSYDDSKTNEKGETQPALLVFIGG